MAGDQNVCSPHGIALSSFVDLLLQVSVVNRPIIRILRMNNINLHSKTRPFAMLLPTLSHDDREQIFFWDHLLAAVTKFQGKLASLRQVNSPNSQDNLQICCANMYLVRFLANFASFCEFCGILRIT